MYYSLSLIKLFDYFIPILDVMVSVILPEIVLNPFLNRRVTTAVKLGIWHETVQMNVQNVVAWEEEAAVVALLVTTVTRSGISLETALKAGNCQMVLHHIDI